MNALTIDLEDYYHVSAFADSVGQSDWGRCEDRLQRNSDKLLSLLAETRTRATFFVLGWVAEKYPALMREIADAGHEMACHSLLHRRVFDLTPQEFREDTAAARDKIQQASGKPVRGYRAPSFSVTEESTWALEILAELGFSYDSSIFPVRHPNYGIPEARRSPFVVDTKAGPIVEFPMSTLEIEGMRAPFGGGAYFRLLPYWYTKFAVKVCNEQGFSVNFYLHPWEIDPDQPKMQGSITSQLRHYLGLRGTERKLRQLLKDFPFGALGDQVPAVLRSEQKQVLAAV